MEIDTKLPAILVHTEPALRDEESFYFFGGGVGRDAEGKSKRKSSSKKFLRICGCVVGDSH